MIAPILSAVEELQANFGIAPAKVIRADLDKNNHVWLETQDGLQHAWFCKQQELKPAFPESDSAIPLCGSFPMQGRNTRILSWRPGRRIALRIDHGDGFDVIKGLRPKKIYAALRSYQLAQQVLTANDDFVVPKVCLVPEWNALRLTGLRMEPIKISTEHANAFHAVGNALARFQHNMPTRDLPLRGFHSELAVLGDLAERHIRGMGTLPEGWDEQRRRLFGAEHYDRNSPVACHRDLHDGQLLVDAKRVALLDFDLLASASPLLDLGNLIAHLHLRKLQGITQGEDASKACERSLLAGYGLQHRAKLNDELNAYKSTSYLRLALVYSMRPRWRHLTQRLIGFAKHCLDDPQSI